MGEKPNNLVDNRPLSPHLSIYRLPLAAVLSISHRMTGVGLFFGTLVLAWGIIMGAYGCRCILELFGTLPGQIILAAWSFALFYHSLNGLRHLYWDTGRGLTIPAVTLSGIAVVVGAVVLTAISWVLALNIL